MSALLSVVCILYLTASSVAELSHPDTIVLPLRPPARLASTKSHPNFKQPKVSGATGEPAPDHLLGCPSMDFAAPFIVGGQSFQLIIDTGSTTLALASSECTTCTAADVSPLYTPSSGSVNLNQPINGTYLDGSGWAGRTIQDSVATAGLEPVPLILATIDSEKQFFGSSSCPNTPAPPAPLFYQGIIGFAYPNEAQGATQQYWAQLLNSSVPAGLPNLFTLQMCIGTGQLWLGGYDNSTFLPDTLQWTTIVDDSFYVVQPADLLIGGVSAVPSGEPSEFGQTIVDSGTSTLVLPKTIYNAIVKLLKATPAFVKAFGSTFFKNGKCIAAKDGSTTEELNANLPPLTVILGNATDLPMVNLTLLPVSSYLNYAPDSNGNPFYCSGIDSEDSDTVMGWSFINPMVIIHDLANNRLGFAQVVPSTCPTADSAAPIERAQYRWARLYDPAVGGVDWRCTNDSGVVMSDETLCEADITGPVNW